MEMPAVAKLEAVVKEVGMVVEELAMERLVVG